MLKTIKILIASFVIIVFSLNNLQGQSYKELKSYDSEGWKKIVAFFSPEKEFANKFGEFRSPLLFYNGDAVKSEKDWKKRRKEILDKWTELMGNWPPIIKNQKPEFLDTIKRENFTQHRIRFYWTPNEKTEGYLLIPDGEGTKPAVIVVFYEPETAIGLGKPNRDWAYQLAKQGFVTLAIGTTEASKNKTYSIFYPKINNAKVQPLSMLAYAAANAWNILAHIENVDSTRIGIMGHSFGGKWAMFASCLYDKFACGVWSDPGIVFDEQRGNVNYWEPWYLGYHPKPWRKRGIITKDNPAKGLYPRLVKEGYNLTDIHALMAPRPFLVSGGSEDPPKRWEALNHSIAVNKLLGFKNRVAMTNREEHSPNEKSNEQIFSFFNLFLKP